MRVLRLLATTGIAASLLVGVVGAVGASNGFDDGAAPDTPVAHEPRPSGGDQDWIVDPVQSPFAYWRFDGEYWDDQSGQPYAQKVYFLGGRDAAGGTDGAIWWFEPATDSYGQPTGNPSLPTPISNYTIARLQDSHGLGLYVFGGRPGAGGVDSTVQVYYPATNEAMALGPEDDFPGVADDGNPAVPGGVVVYDNKVYVFGGFAASLTTITGVSAQTWIFDPMAAAGSRWTQGPDLSLARAYLASTVVDGKVFAIGGNTWDGAALNVVPITEVLDVPGGATSWELVADMPVASSGLAGCDETQAFGFDSDSTFHLRGKIIIAGCGQWPNEYPDGFVYDTQTDTWLSLFPLNQSRRNHAGAFVPAGASGPDQENRAWVWGGRQGADTTILQTAEHKKLGYSPLSVTLSEFATDAPAAVNWLPLGLAALGLLGAGGTVFLRRRRAL